IKLEIIPVPEGLLPLNSTSNAAAHFPAPVYEQQDAVLARAFEVLRNGIAEHAFPAASAAVTYHGKLIALKALGRFTYESVSPEVTIASIFDLASLTKVAATTAMAMILYERGLLDLETPVVAIVPEFGGRDDKRREEITLHMLLAHSSGLPAYEKLFLQAHTPEELLHAAFTISLGADPGTRAVY